MSKFALESTKGQETIKWQECQKPVLVWFSAYFDVFYLSTPQTIYKLLLIRCKANTCDFPYELLLITYPISLVINLETVFLFRFC